MKRMLLITVTWLLYLLPLIGLYALFVLLLWLGGLVWPMPYDAAKGLVFGLMLILLFNLPKYSKRWKLATDYVDLRYGYRKR